MKHIARLLSDFSLLKKNNFNNFGSSDRFLTLVLKNNAIYQDQPGTLLMRKMGEKFSILQHLTRLN